VLNPKRYKENNKDGDKLSKKIKEIPPSFGGSKKSKG
jgi:hypothetical protein